MKTMLKIALVGAPNSGKTELAQQIVEALPEKKVAVVDDYIAAIEERSDNTLGHFGSYLGNLQAAIGRWEAERKLIKDENPDILVTCGSAVETVVYNGIKALIEHNVDGDELTLRALQNDKRASMSMTMLGIMNFDCWDYDHCFYLPFVVEEGKEDEAKWDLSVDAHIADAAEVLNVKYESLSALRDERIGQVLQEIVVDEAPTPDE